MACFSFRFPNLVSLRTIHELQLWYGNVVRLVVGGLSLELCGVRTLLALLTAFKFENTVSGLGVTFGIAAS